MRTEVVSESLITWDSISWTIEWLRTHSADKHIKANMHDVRTHSANKHIKTNMHDGSLNFMWVLFTTYSHSLIFCIEWTDIKHHRFCVYSLGEQRHLNKMFLDWLYDKHLNCGRWQQWLSCTNNSMIPHVLPTTGHELWILLNTMWRLLWPELCKACQSFTVGWGTWPQ